MSERVLRGIGRLSVALTLLAAAAAPVAAQAVGLGAGAGGAFLDGHDGARGSFAVSALATLGPSLLATLSYVQWRALDGNDVIVDEAGEFGERGVSLTLLLPVLRSDRLAWLVGGGVSGYEQRRPDADGTDERFQTALTASAMIVAALDTRWSVYVRGDVSAPTNDLSPRWTFVHAGLAFRVF